MIRAVKARKISAEAAGKATQTLGLKSRYLKDLGQGVEGLAQLRTSAKHQLQVAKLYDPKGGLSSKEVLKEKVRTFKTMSGKGNFAKYYGKDPKRPITFHEYSPGTAGIGSSIKQTLLTKAQATLRGVPMADVVRNPGNIQGGKIIDFLPAGRRGRKALQTTTVGKQTEGFKKAVKSEVWKALSLKKKPAAAIEGIKYQAIDFGSKLLESGMTRNSNIPKAIYGKK